MTKPVTATTEKALQLRKNVKKKKPDFARPESWRYKRLSEGWRRPRGLDNKMRRKIKGWPPTVNVGYRGPKATRGLHPSGYKEVLVYNTDDLEKIDPKIQAARIAHTVGKRKRARILVEARKKKIIILNLREVKEAVGKEKELTEEKEKEEKLEEEEVEEEAETEKPEQKQKKKRKGRARKQ
jgi:large subunit ribosomal protein L32e